LGNIPLFGLSPESLDLFGRWRAFFAGQTFSLTALGVMPIIDASLILQTRWGIGSGVGLFYRCRFFAPDNYRAYKLDA